VNFRNGVRKSGRDIRDDGRSKKCALDSIEFPSVDELNTRHSNEKLLHHSDGVRNYKISKIASRDPIPASR
jgi:hypothetical protein